MGVLVFRIAVAATIAGRSSESGDSDEYSYQTHHVTPTSRVCSSLVLDLLAMWTMYTVSTLTCALLLGKWKSAGVARYNMVTAELY